MTVMTAHIAVPALESDPRRPATLSEAILEQVLRKELGFGGLIVSDSMKMKGLTQGYWSGEAAVQALEAGVDVLLDPPDAQVVLGALLEAVKTGRLSEARVERSVERILQAKAWLGLNRQKQTDSRRLARRINAPALRQQVQDLADASVTLVKDDPSQLPLDVRGIRSGHLSRCFRQAIPGRCRRSGRSPQDAPRFAGGGSSLLRSGSLAAEPGQEQGRPSRSLRGGPAFSAGDRDRPAGTADAAGGLAEGAGPGQILRRTDFPGRPLPDSAALFFPHISLCL